MSLGAILVNLLLAAIGLIVITVAVTYVAYSTVTYLRLRDARDAERRRSPEAPR